MFLAASRALQIIVGDMMQFDYTKRPSAKKLQRYQNVKELISKTSNRPAFLVKNDTICIIGKL